MGTCPDFLGKIGESLIEPGAIDARQNQPFALPGAGMDKAIEIGPLVAWLYRGDGTLPHRGPNLANDGFEAKAMLVKRPDFDGGFGILLG